MEKILAILIKVSMLCQLILVAQELNAQNTSHPPSSVLNTYTYTEKDGVNDINYGVSAIDSSGRLYMLPYNRRTILVLGNNYTYNINIDDDKPNSRIVELYTRGDKLHICVENGMFIYNQNQKQGFIHYPEKSLFYAKDGIFIFRKNDTLFNIQKFDLDAFHELGEVVIRRSFASIATCPIIGGVVLSHTDVIAGTIEIYKLTQGSPAKKIVSTKINPYVVYGINENKIFSINTRQQLPPYFRNVQTQTDFYYPIIGNHQSLSTITTNPKLVLGMKNNELFYYVIDMKGKSALSRMDNISEAGTYYLGSSNKPMRAFSSIKKYPRLFESTNSNDIFALVQANDGKIWAASYQGSLTIIDNDNNTKEIKTGNWYLNGGLAVGDKVFFFSENYGKRFHCFDANGTIGVIDKELFGFYLAKSSRSNKVFLATGGYSGLWITDSTSLLNNTASFTKIDSSRGLQSYGVTCIAEDTLGRIWMGATGLGCYDRNYNQLTYWSLKNGTTSLNARSAITDKWGTVWFGTLDNGLHYYNDYSTKLSITDLKRLNHPLLSNGRFINSFAIHGKWLVMGNEDKICLLDLETWHSKSEVVLRYLNPQEASFSSKTEQNTMLVDRRDSSLWFSTSDMLYQWDLTTWLSLPTYRVSPNVVLVHHNKDSAITNQQPVEIEPDENSIGFRIWFQSKDNMPRYMSVALVKDGDTIHMPDPSLDTKFQYNNLAPGKYQLIIDIFHSDGTTSRDIYQIKIDSFWWQKWWVWVLLSLLALVPIIIILNERRKQAELKKLQAERERQLANLQLVSLSSQFRPHFILNALNTIGASMEKNPVAESVLSRLGESVNLIFNHSKEQKVLHDFKTEWRLVENVIEIHRLMYLKNLRLELPSNAELEQANNLQVPMGLLQIPVENALLHGLSNDEKGNHFLQIAISQSLGEKTTVVITDNGVGRERSAAMSNHTQHGTGTKNLAEMIAIINNQNTEKITMHYEDLAQGTKVIVHIPHHIRE